MSKDKKNKVSVKQAMNHDETVVFLEDLLESFKSQKIVINSNEDSITMIPSEEIQLEVKASSKETKNKIKIELVWHEAATSDLEIKAEEDAQNTTELK